MSRTARRKGLGSFRERVSIQAATRSRDAEGGFANSWATVTDGTVWAAIEPISGGETARGRKVDAKVTHTVRMQYFAGVTNQHRILYGSRALNIVRVLNLDERGVEIELDCREDV